jgi:hypothetical protein
MSKQVTSNTFSEGFIADMNPLVTPNNLLTDCLNGTFITFNGNEFTLQNDMGNAVVETAALKKGYIPIGIKEYNGIAYIVSYNPLENRVEIGSFPSPERNFSGEDFDTEDYQVEGCVLSTKKFYKPNLLHPEIGDNDTPPEITSPKLNVYTELQQPNPTLTVKTLEDYTSTFVPKNPSGLGVEDYWTLNTKHNQSDFIINKNSISDDFSSYPDLTLH